jgi:hypothetical protein
MRRQPMAVQVHDREVAWEAMPQSARRRGFDMEAMPPA